MENKTFILLSVLLIIGIGINLIVWSNTMELVKSPCTKCIKENPIKAVCLLQQRPLFEIKIKNNYST